MTLKAPRQKRGHTRRVHAKYRDPSEHVRKAKWLRPGELVRLISNDPEAEEVYNKLMQREQEKNL